MVNLSLLVFGAKRRLLAGVARVTDSSHYLLRVLRYGCCGVERSLLQPMLEDRRADWERSWPVDFQGALKAFFSWGQLSSNGGGGDYFFLSLGANGRPAVHEPLCFQ